MAPQLMDMDVELLRRALEGGVTATGTAKTWTYSPTECFCEDVDDPNPFCILAGVHDPAAPYTVELVEIP